ncbi:MAG TPA: helix-turn-helix domain-containing protein [Candidatus Nanoarchaeia archaeon]|nr:helix-turn-helix domain-containing protein [Candidatus Nanoarchaeia archaeon]
MKEKALRKFGLSDREIRVYIVLLELGEALASKIAQKTDTPRTLVYDILEKLLDKGVVSYVIKSNKKYFSALEPSSLIEVLRNKEWEKEKLVQEALPELLSLKHKDLDKKTKVEIYEGKEGVKTLFNDVLKVGKEFLCFGSTGISPDILPYELSRFHKERIKRKIHWKVIYNNDELGRKRGMEASKWKYSQVKYMEKTSPTTTYCYGNKVAIVLWIKERLLAVMIEDEIITNSFKEFFEVLWKNAKSI